MEDNQLGSFDMKNTVQRVFFPAVKVYEFELKTRDLNFYDFIFY